jgi:protein farnesyltransferase/geranylgeranyltransferase type-1 subunit alpha
MVIEKLGAPLNELEMTSSILLDDPKNYHVWSHRQWVLKQFALFDNELDFVDVLINKDVRNNSAWNQRHHVICSTSGFTKAVIERELKYAHQSALKAPSNDSVWNYLRGLLFKPDFAHFDALQSTIDACVEIDAGCVPALSVHIDVLRKVGGADNNAKAVTICMALSTTHDPVRVNYWQFIANTIKQQ